MIVQNNGDMFIMSGISGEIVLKSEGQFQEECLTDVNEGESVVASLSEEGNCIVYHLDVTQVSA